MFARLAETITGKILNKIKYLHHHNLKSHILCEAVIKRTVYLPVTGT
jgi:hypothetical protein